MCLWGVVCAVGVSVGCGMCSGCVCGGVVVLTHWYVPKGVGVAIV